MLYQPLVEFEALKQDVNTLLAKFCKKQSVRFVDFAATWRELNFTAVFGCTERVVQASKMRIAERLMRIASEFLSPNATFVYRVAAIYCLYAVYFTQICEPKVKIRMTPTMWKDLLEFLQVVQTHQHLDVAYAIHKLRRSRAFAFTAMPKHLELGRMEFMLGVMEEGPPLRLITQGKKYIDELLEKRDFVKSLAKVQSDYEEVRARVLAESSEQERASLGKNLCVSHSDFSSEVDKLLDLGKGPKRMDRIKPEQLEASQRPVLITSRAAIGERHLDIDETSQNRSENELGHSQRINKVLEKAFATSATGDTASQDSHGDSEFYDREYYRRSAMITVYNQPSWRRRTRMKNSATLYPPAFSAAPEAALANDSDEDMCDDDDETDDHDQV